MRKTLGIIFKVLLVTVVVVWIGLILVEYFRYQDNEPMLVVLKEETLAYEDGHVYVYGKEFGHVFIPVRDTLPNNS